MKINFDYPTSQIQMSLGVPLEPGENNLPDEIAEELIKGSDILIATIAKKTGKSEAEVRKERKGKGIFTKIEGRELPVSTTTKKKGKGE